MNKKGKQRSFVIVIHDEHGCLLLKSSNEKKGYQLPGGRLDEQDKQAAGAMASSSPPMPLLEAKVEEAFRIGAARELFEETGLDYRNRTHLLKPLKYSLPKEWRFFALNITNEDSLSQSFSTLKPMPLCILRFFHAIFKSHKELFSPVECLNAPNFYLKLSPEHSGFRFEKDLTKASELIRYHSKGICSKAVTMFQNQN
ncbi:NUDIX domain protein [Cryptosporidium felis]|nr:NUDIX domain protein [Cryptosporidium felis]